jgi:GAF domain-containing protein
MKQTDKLIAWRRTIAHMHGRRKAEEFLGFLAASGKLLSAEISFYDSLPKLAHLVVPFLGDWMNITVYAGENVVKNVAEKSRAGLDAVHIYQLRKEFRPFLQFRPAETTEAAADPSTSDPAPPAASIQPVLSSQEIHSCVVIPLTLPTGRIGTLIIATMKQANEEENRTYGPSELALAEELGRRVSLAIERSILYDEDALTVKGVPHFNAGSGGVLN